MSNAPVCYFAAKGGLEDKIAGLLNNGSTKDSIATLRGLYEMKTGTPLIPEGVRDKDLSSQQILEASQKLNNFKRKEVQNRLKEMSNSTKHPASSFKQLYQVDGWNGTIRRDRINMIALQFSVEVKKRLMDAEKRGLSLTRSQIINGYKSGGKYYEGQFSVFESIFSTFLNDYTNAMKLVYQANHASKEMLDRLPDSKKQQLELARHIVQEYPKIFNNWGALCTFARMSLRDTEGLKLGNTLEYAAPTTPDNYSMDAPLEDSYDMEESVREAWMQHQAETSAFSSLGTEVRKFLGSISEVNSDGTIVRDDLGYPKKLDPVATHQYLASLLRGVTSEKEMVEELMHTSKTNPTVLSIVKALEYTSRGSFEDGGTYASTIKNPTIITQLLLDMHKNLVPYSAMVMSKGRPVVKVLNKRSNPLHGLYLLRIAANHPVSSFSLYNAKGEINWNNYVSLFSEVKELLPSSVRENKKNSIFSSFKKYATGFYDKNFPYNKRIDFIQRAAEALGITLSLKDAQHIYSDSNLRREYLKAVESYFTDTFSTINYSTTKPAFETLFKYHGVRPSTNTEGVTADDINKYDTALNSLKEQYRSLTFQKFNERKIGRNQESSRGFGYENIFKMLDTIAESSLDLNRERRVSWFDRKGKTTSRYSDRTPSYMGDMVDKIHKFVKRGDAKGLRNFIMDKWGKSSFFYNKETGKFLNKWIQDLYDSIKEKDGNAEIDNYAMAKVFEFDEFLGSNLDRKPIPFENFTSKQHAEAMLKQFLQIKDQTNDKSPLAKYPCFILGDSGAQMFFTAKRYSHTDILNGLKDVFRQEIERWKYVEAANKSLIDNGYKPIDNFSETLGEFTMLTFLNPTFADGKYWKILTGNTEDTNLSKEDIVKESTDALDNTSNSNLTKALEQYMQDSLNTFKDTLVNLGVLSKTTKDNGETIYAVTDDKMFSQSIRNYRSNTDERGLDSMLKDFFWNTKYATIEQLQMFTVDPSFYDHRYPVKDLQKRYKEIYAPGKGVSLEAIDYNGKPYMSRPNERVAYFDDISVSSADVNPSFMDVIKATFGEDSDITKLYTKNTLTDGQGYRSLESYRSVKGMAGEWTRQMEAAYNEIQDIRHSGRNLTDNDIHRLSELMVLFQPIKPYMYTLEKLQINNNGDCVLVPVQHKYAEVVLIPELLMDGKLKDIATWMENHVDEGGNAAPIDLVASNKCVKVGCFGSVPLKGADTTESIYESLNKAYIHNLPWADYRIQSGVPEHLSHAQLVGTQSRKLFFDGINKAANYNYLNNIFHTTTDDPRGMKIHLPRVGKVHLTGNTLISLYNCLTMANMFDSYDSFTGQISSNKALSDKLIQNVIANSNQSEDNAFAFSLIEDGENKGNFTIPLGEPGVEHDATALMYSLFKKNVNKQKILGGSAVQASAMGLSGWSDTGDLFEVVSPDGDNVLYDEIEMPWNRTYTTPTGKVVPLRFEDWCNPDGTLKMSDEIVYGEDAKEYLSWPISGRDEYGRAKDDKQGYYKPLIETKYPGILNIIAYRIPTEREYSMINCKVFRFSNPLAGGTLKVPSSRTTTAGFDFDIDKLYFYMKEFSQTHLTDDDVSNIWRHIYTEHPELKEALQQARDNYKRSNEIFDSLSQLFPKSNFEGLKENSKITSEERLYNYWDQALELLGSAADNIARTPEEQFNRYLENHRDKYPIFDIYNPDVSPLNPIKGKDGSIVTPGNSRVARNNLMIDLMRQRLMDKETLKARYTPGGFSKNSAAALRMRILRYADKADITTNGNIDWAKVDDYAKRIKEGIIKDPEPEMDVSDPSTILMYNQQNQIAGKLIGIFANQNTNHVYASTLSELRLTNPIFFGTHTTTGLSDMLHAPNGVDVNTNMAEYLAASVDAVKDPVLNYLNLNTITADSAALLARIGYSPLEIGLLFSQPIIKDVCTYAANNSTGTDEAIVEILKKYGGRVSLSNIKYEAQNGSLDRLANNIIQYESEYSNGQPMSEEFKKNQLQILALFNEILSDSSDVNSFVQCTRFTAANSIGSTFGDQIAQEERANNFITKYMTGDDSKKRLQFKLYDEGTVRSLRSVNLSNAAIENTQGVLNTSSSLLDLSPEEYMAQMALNPLAFEQCMMDLTRKVSKKLFAKNVPFYTEAYTKMRDVVRGLTKYGTLGADTINALHKEFMVYLLANQKGSMFDGEAVNTFFSDTVGHSITNREYYTQVFPHLIADLSLNSKLAAVSPFFKALTILGKTDNGAEGTKKNVLKGIELTVQGMGGLQANASNSITELWSDAIRSTDTVEGKNGIQYPVNQLALDAYMYCFYKLGFNFHPTSFITLAPTALKLNLKVNTQTETKGYIDFINEVINGKEISDNDIYLFAKQFMLNHPDNNKFVYTPVGTTRDAVMRICYSNGDFKPSFTLSLKELNSSGNNAGNLFLLKSSSSDKSYAFKPIIAVKGRSKLMAGNAEVTCHYMADSKGKSFNTVDAADGTITYRLVHIQGAKGQLMQYFSAEAYADYQRDGFFDTTEEMYDAKKAQEAEAAEKASPIEDSTNDAATRGTDTASLDNGSLIKVGDNISDMFTDKEWQQMFELFKQDHSEIFSQDTMQGFEVKQFKEIISDTSEVDNVNTLNKLRERLNRGEMPKTLDDKGNEIPVCRID